MERRERDNSCVDKCLLVHAVGAPLAVVHGLLPTNAYDGVEGKGRMGEIVALVGVVVCQILAPHFLIGASTVNQLRSNCSKYGLQPIQILIPVEVGDFVFVHVEGVDGDGTRRVIARCSQELVLLAQGKSTTLDRYHAGRGQVADPFLCLEVGCCFIVVVPACGVGHFGVEFAFAATCSKE